MLVEFSIIPLQNTERLTEAIAEALQNRGCVGAACLCAGAVEHLPGRDVGTRRCRSCAPATNGCAEIWPYLVTFIRIGEEVGNTGKLTGNVALVEAAVGRRCSALCCGRRNWLMA